MSVPRHPNALERTRTSNLCSEDKDDIHFTTGALYEIFENFVGLDKISERNFV